jgi:arylsulfatase A
VKHLLTRWKMLLKRNLLTGAAVFLAVAAAAVPPKPNFIIIFADDLGYGDPGCYGQKRIKTPYLDRMAAEGMLFTDFYSAGAVCTPSRAALLTGCYPKRVELGSAPAVRPDGRETTQSVIHSASRVGLNPNEITVAEILKGQGYATACIGKWHLGHRIPFLPTRQGFDYYYGIPYSNDMKPTVLMRGEQVIEKNAHQPTLTERYTEEAIRFITEHREQPFFVYLPHSMPHTPLHVSERFAGRSEGGLYGDVIECLDWSVGEIVSALQRLGLDERTLVIFSSDNGPWLIRGDHGGFPTPLRNGKGSTYEGGMRVPCIMRWPGKIPAGKTCAEVATMMDFMPTLARLAGGSAPTDRIIDGHDIFALMTAQPDAKSPYEAFFYYRQTELQAVRSGPWKLRLATKWAHEEPYRRVVDPEAVLPEALYNLETDIGEQKSVLDQHRDTAKQLRRLADKAREDMGDDATGNPGRNVRPVGRLEDPVTSDSLPAGLR